MVGQMIAFDRFMNLVLADCEEFRTIKFKNKGKKRSADDGEEKRTLGLVILRGEQIISISIEAPPPSGQGKRVPGSSAVGIHNRGIARPAGRGMPIVPVGGAPAGLIFV
jgi:small nuclear ribonucleoprotein B and B'